MIHEDITISGSFLVSGSFTLPRVASSSLADTTTGSMFYDTSQNVVKIYTGEGLTGFVAVGDQAEPIYNPSASFIEIPLTGSQAAGTNIATMSISDTDNQTPFSASLSGTNASSFTFEYTNADSSSGFIEAAGTLATGTYNYTVTVFDSALNSSSVDRTTVIAVNPPVDIEYLVIAGGGGGSGGYGDGAGGIGGAGGGAGGMQTSTLSSVAADTTLTITVGGGGGASGTGFYAAGISGNDSSIAGSGITTVTSIGGGRGGSRLGSGPEGGGSGGGAATDTGQSGGAGTAGQGNAGGNAAGSGVTRASASGGGKGGAGSTPTTTSGANGGAGANNSITGTSVGYAGGGGGGATTGGSGGTATHGGGAGGSATGQAAGATTANTGGGGGGGGAGTSAGVGSSGASGVVILKVLTSAYSGTTTGSPTVTTDGSYTVIKYTSSGTYTT